MDDVRVIEVKQSVFADNDRRAAELRGRLRAQGTFLLNLMSSPGAGKTTTLLRTVEALSDELSIAVMDADIDSDVDARAFAGAGVRTIQIHTGGMCHLDASMTEQGLDELLVEHGAAGGDGGVAGSGVGTAGKASVAGSACPDASGASAADIAAPVDLVILENVGNLVCPAEFDTGASENAMILSVPEGDDKPLKYPLMFQTCNVVLINKMDALGVFDTFSLERAVENIHMRNPAAEVIPISAKTGDGIDAWADWLRRHVAAWKGEEAR